MSPQAKKKPVAWQHCRKGPTDIAVGARLNAGCPRTGLPDDFVEASYVVLRGRSKMKVGLALDRFWD